MPESIRVTVFGLGEAGSLIAADLAAAGAQVNAYDPASVPTPGGLVRHERAGSAAEGSRLVLAVTAAADSTKALTQAADVMAPETVYADLSTASPELKRDLAGEAASHGLIFADVALMTPVPGKGLATPALASGPGASPYAAVVNPLGAQVEVLGDQPGDAAARKLLRSVVAKGLTALLMESMEAARAHYDSEWLWEHLVETISGADESLMRRLIEGTPIHVDRRIAEMEAAQAFLESLDVPPTMTAATVEALRRVQQQSKPD